MTYFYYYLVDTNQRVTFQMSNAPMPTECVEITKEEFEAVMRDRSENWPESRNEEYVLIDDAPTKQISASKPAPPTERL